MAPDRVPWAVSQQARIVALLVERVDIGTNGLDLRLRVDGLTALTREFLTAQQEGAQNEERAYSP
jgi:site-specific DNA recombinase